MYKKILFIILGCSLASVSLAQSVDTNCYDFTQNFGYRSEDKNVNGEVSKLQKFLGLRQTGGFGNLTAYNIWLFQRKNNIISQNQIFNPKNVYFGPRTRKVIDSICNDLAKTDIIFTPRSTSTEVSSGEQEVVKTKPPVLPQTLGISGFPASQTSSLPLQESQLVSLLELRATTSSYYTKSGLQIGGETADVIKVVQVPGETKYIGLYHHTAGALFNTYLATSEDLKFWTKIGTISEASGMPDIRILPDHSVLVGLERNPSGNRPYIEVRYYTSVKDFLTSPQFAAKTINIPQTQNATADGTPEFGSITYSGNILQSTIEISYHYFLNSQIDKQAKGVLTNFSTFVASEDTTVNTALTAIGYSDIGGREYIQVGGITYQIIEANTTVPYGENGWDSWRIFLLNKSNGNVTKLQPQIPGGAYSIGNPQISFITLPGGAPGFVLSYFLFSQGASKTRPGPYFYVHSLALTTALQSASQ